DLAPGFLQQAYHHLRQRFAKQTLVECVLDFLACDLRLGPTLFGIAGALFEQFAAASFVPGEGKEVGQQLGEDRRIINEIVQQARHDLFDLLIQAVALCFVLIDPAHGGGGNFVEQAAGGVAAAAEKGLVQNGNFEQRNLQATNQRFERVGQGAIVENELKQHRYQVDDIFIHLANDPRLATLAIDALQQLLKLLLQAVLIDRKSTRLNSSHVKISYAVFCLKKKKKTRSTIS